MTAIILLVVLLALALFLPVAGGTALPVTKIAALMVLFLAFFGAGIYVELEPVASPALPQRRRREPAPNIRSVAA